MKSIMAWLTYCLVVLSGSLAFADVSVNGYYRKDGTYVAPHHRSDPNGTVSDNWSTKGNINPYTGKEGTKNPDSNLFKNPNSYERSYKQRTETTPTYQDNSNAITSNYWRTKNRSSNSTVNTKPSQNTYLPPQRKPLDRTHQNNWSTNSNSE